MGGAAGPGEQGHGTASRAAVTPGPLEGGGRPTGWRALGGDAAQSGAGTAPQFQSCRNGEGKPRCGADEKADAPG